MLYSYRRSCRKSFRHNSEILYKPLEIIPVLNHAYIRIHSHGELINRIHYENILKIADKNPHCKFSLFTKRIDIIKHYPIIPKNLVIIYSNPALNKPIYEIPDYCHKVFNVIIDDSIKENCKGKCIDCLKCYKRPGNPIIIEKIKKYSKGIDTARDNILKLFDSYTQ